NIWIGTEDGLYRYSKNGLKHFNKKNGLIDNRVLSLMEDSEHNIWIGTFEGLSKIKNDKITNYTKKNGLPDNIIISMFEDREKVKWFGTNGGGVSKLACEMFLNITGENGLKDELILAIEQDKNGNYWFGSYNGGITVFDGKKFKYYTEKDSLLDNRIWSIKRDSKGNMWIGSEKGITKYDGKKFTHFIKKSSGFPIPIFSIIAGKKGNIWLATGIGPIKFDGKKFINCETDTNFKDLAWSIFQDSKGDIWVGTNSKGVYNLANHKFHFNEKNGLPNNLVRSIFEDHKGNLWFGTNEGLAKYDGKKLTTFTKKDGLSDNTCYSIIEDNNHNLWIGTNQGLNKINLDYKKISFINYNVNDGLISNELNSRSCYLDDKGYLWFGSTRGVIKCNPEKDIINTNPPPIYIENFIVNNENIPFENKIKLKHFQNNIMIEFFSLTFISESNIKYYYRLKGLSDEWNNTSNRKFAVFNHLSPGKYEFDVYAMNKYGIASKKTARLFFTITPPFWKSSWFLSLSTILFIGCIFIGYRYRVNSIKRKSHIEQQLFDAQKIKESEEKYRKLIEQSPNAVFITDCDGKFVDSNNRTLEILGYSNEELFRLNIKELFSKECKKEGLKKIVEISSGKDLLTFESEFVKKDKTVLPVELSLSSLELGSKKYIQFVMNDISERKEIQNKLIQTEKLASIGTLVSGVAHELNNPLAIISGYSELLLKDSSLNDKNKERAQKIKLNTERCAHIIENLLGFSRRKEPEKREININELIDKTVELREYQLKVNNILIKKNYHSDIPSVFCDPDQLQQVFLNLINNAFEAMYEFNKRGILEIKTYSKNGSVYIEFIDDGPGISKEIQSKIFDPFFTTKEIGKGTGLGLSVCYGIIKEHNGEIFIDTYREKGARFIIRLPAGNK
ncbi:hypothetical protein DRQ09_01505, partial [candidate division KSB1 bacterium]